MPTVKVKKVAKKGKAKQSQSQTVIVNIQKNKRASTGKPSGPTQSQILQQQMIQALTQRREPPQPQPNPLQPLIASTMLTSQLLQPIQQSLAQLMARQPQAPNINIAPPNINVPVNVAPPNINVHPPNVNVPVNVAPPNVNVHPPHIDIRQGDTVINLPDAPLVQPQAPLVPAGPQRLDNPHEDAPIPPNLALSKEEEEEEEEPQQVASSASSSSASSSASTSYETFMNDIRSGTSESRKKTGSLKIRDLAKRLGITVPQNSLKDDIVDLIARSYRNNPQPVYAILNQYRK